MADAQEKKILILAGPNGAGKTTFAEAFLPNEAQCMTFVNADLIAAGLAPFNPESAALRAGRLMLQEIKDHVKRGASFAFETTLSGSAYAKMIPTWQSQGYVVKLLFLKLKSPELAIVRVSQRVKQGGHRIPEHVIRRRYEAGLRNLELLYKPIVDKYAVYDSSGQRPILLTEGGKG